MTTSIDPVTTAKIDINLPSTVDRSNLLSDNDIGGIEPHFKDYKPGTFDISKSKIRNVQALGNILMMLEIAQLLAIRLGLVVIETETRTVLDWHGDRGLSLSQLGISRSQTTVP